MQNKKQVQIPVPDPSRGSLGIGALQYYKTNENHGEDIFEVVGKHTKHERYAMRQASEKFYNVQFPTITHTNAGTARDKTLTLAQVQQWNDTAIAEEGVVCAKFSKDINGITHPWTDMFMDDIAHIVLESPTLSAKTLQNIKKNNPLLTLDALNEQMIISSVMPSVIDFPKLVEGESDLLTTAPNFKPHFRISGYWRIPRTAVMGIDLPGVTNGTISRILNAMAQIANRYTLTNGGLYGSLARIGNTRKVSLELLNRYPESERNKVSNIHNVMVNWGLKARTKLLTKTELVNLRSGFDQHTYGCASALVSSTSGLVSVSRIGF